MEAKKYLNGAERCQRNRKQSCREKKPDKLQKWDRKENKESKGAEAEKKNRKRHHFTSGNTFNSSQEVAWGLHLVDQIPRELRRKKKKSNTSPTP